MLLTLYIAVSHVFTILRKGALEIIGCFKFNKCFTTGTAFFGICETNSVYFSNNVTICKNGKLSSELNALLS